jgi:hypothetical protein
MMSIKDKLNQVQTKASGLIGATVAPPNAHELANVGIAKSATGQMDPTTGLTREQIAVLQHQPQDRAEAIQALVRAQGPMTALKNAGLGAVAGYLIGGSSLPAAALGAAAGGLYGGYKNRVNAADTLNTYNATLDANDLNAPYQSAVYGALNAASGEIAQLPLTSGQAQAAQAYLKTIQQNPNMSPQALATIMKQIEGLTSDAKTVYNQRQGYTQLQRANAGQTPFTLPSKSSPTVTKTPSKPSNKTQSLPISTVQNGKKQEPIVGPDGVLKAAVSVQGNQTKLNPYIVGKGWVDKPVIASDITPQQASAAAVGGATQRQNLSAEQQKMAMQDRQFGQRLGEDRRQADQSNATAEKNAQRQILVQTLNQKQARLDLVLQAIGTRPPSPAQVAQIGQMTNDIKQLQQRLEGLGG